MRNALKSTFGAVLIVLFAYAAYGAIAIHTYTRAFEETQNGESLKAVLRSFGSPSHIEPRQNGSGYDAGSRSVCSESCWLRLWYEVPFTFGVKALTVDFNANQEVIHKYEWNSP